MLVFRHPKYYEEMRKRARAHQKKLQASQEKKAISSDDTSTDGQERTPKDPSFKRQASSTKHQAFEPTCSIAKRQASQPE